ncbi:MAG: hypothetical protein RR313_09230 [Anaerovoracaceae bacterium]
MNIQAARPNTNYYSTRTSKAPANNDLSFSPHLNQASAMKSSDTTPSSDKINTENNTSSNYQSSATICGMYWDDQKFADAMKHFDKVTINTDNPINWGTTGEHQLTEGEIETLKNKYDVTNLSEQEFYDLMADLSHLNAVKPEDIVSRYHFKAPVVFFEKAALIFPGTITEKDYHNGKPINNFVEELDNRVDYYSANSESINSAEFVRLNRFVFDQDRFQHLLLDLKFNAQECYQEASRYSNIIFQLKRSH